MTDDALLERAEKREAQARSLVDSTKGQRKLFLIIQFFIQAKHQQDVSAYTLAEGRATFDDILALKLMYLPEHRNGTAGAIRGLGQLLESRGFGALAQSSWIRPTHLPLVASSLKMEPPPVNSSIRFTSNVEYLWMQWLTAASSGVLLRLSELAQRNDVVGQQALQFLTTSREHPEVARLLSRLRAVTVRDATPVGSPPTFVPTMAISGLRKRIISDHVARQQVVWVGWLNDAIAVSTRTGLHPVGVPDNWEGYRVVCQQASALELTAIERARVLNEAP